MDTFTEPDTDTRNQIDQLEWLARGANGETTLTLRDWLALAEAWRIARALRDTRGNRSAAARTLGIGRRTLYTKIEKLGLTPEWRLARAGANGGLRFARAAVGE